MATKKLQLQDADMVEEITKYLHCCDTEDLCRIMENSMAISAKYVGEEDGYIVEIGEIDHLYSDKYPEVK